ncbi:MAG TPA: hypothetical protein V6D48_00965, partial [Oculatellaceae cyanobacterium]
DAGDTADLSKLLKEQGVKCANSYDIGLESSTLERRGVDIWLGCIWILNHAAVPVLVSVVGQLVGKRLQEKFSSAKELKSSDRAKVHADVKLLEGKLSASIKYEGDAETFLKVLEGLNKNDTELKN